LGGASNLTAVKSNVWAGRLRISGPRSPSVINHNIVHRHKASCHLVFSSFSNQARPFQLNKEFNYRRLGSPAQIRVFPHVQSPGVLSPVSRFVRVCLRVNDATLRPWGHARSIPGSFLEPFLFVQRGPNFDLCPEKFKYPSSDSWTGSNAKFWSVLRKTFRRPIPLNSKVSAQTLPKGI
jgi:hypothetical protein